MKLKTLYVGKLNIILMGVLVQVQKSIFLHRKTSCPGTSYPRNTVQLQMSWTKSYKAEREEYNGELWKG
jgi:hypothetical protein